MKNKKLNTKKMLIKSLKYKYEFILLIDLKIK